MTNLTSSSLLHKHKQEKGCQDLSFIELLYKDAAAAFKVVVDLLLSFYLPTLAWRRPSALLLGVQMCTDIAISRINAWSIGANHMLCMLLNKGVRLKLDPKLLIERIACSGKKYQMLYRYVRLLFSRMLL